jgi:hypothetical protein
MRTFGLHPDAVLARMSASASTATPPPSLAHSIIWGALSFAIVSSFAYSIWAFRLIRAEGVMYAAIAVIYIAFTGLALSRLVIGPGAAGRFAALFAVAFLAYAVLWSAFWFGLRGKHYADLWGAIAGLAALTFLIARAFGTTRFIVLLLAVFALHSAGYYLGGWLYGTVRGPTGRLLWGAAHGFGFGAALGFLLHHAQTPLRNRLAAATSAAPARPAASLP